LASPTLHSSRERTLNLPRLESFRSVGHKK
jgi:hypothetical protein